MALLAGGWMMGTLLMSIYCLSTCFSVLEFWTCDGENQVFFSLPFLRCQEMGGGAVLPCVSASSCGRLDWIIIIGILQDLLRLSAAIQRTLGSVH